MARHGNTSEPSESAPERELSELRERVAKLEQRWKVTENFLAKFGTYYNSDGRGAIFIVDQFVQSGANGVALTPHQGLLDFFGLAMKMDERTKKEKEEGVKIIGPCWVPEIIPEAAKEAVEEFGAEGDDGADSKAIS